MNRRLDANIFRILGKHPLDQIEAPELPQAIRKIEDRALTALPTEFYRYAVRVFRYGIATGRCTRNLTADLRGALTPHLKRHQAAVRLEELPDLLKAIAGHFGESTSPRSSTSCLESDLRMTLSIYLPRHVTDARKRDIACRSCQKINCQPG